MGSSSSKVASSVVNGATKRKYPSKSSIPNSTIPRTNVTPISNAPQPTSSSQGTQVHPDPRVQPPSDSKSQHIDFDGRDPQFGAALRRLGPAKPASEAKPGQETFPTSSQPPLGQHGKNIFPSASPTNNPALMTVQARERINKQWSEESEDIGRNSFGGRTLLSAKDIREVLRLRDEVGRDTRDIEKQLRLKPGVLDTLAAQGLIANA